MAHEASGRWVDHQGRSHNFSISSDVADRGHIESLVRSIYPAKTVHINYVGADREKQKRERDAHVANERAKREQQQSRLNQGGSNNISSNSSSSSNSFNSSNSRSCDYDEPMTEEEEENNAEGILLWIGIVGGFWAFFTFTPWILMLGGGALGTWVGEKVTGQSVEEYTDSTEDSGHKKAAIVLTLALLCGGFGFIQGNNLQNDWNTTDQIEEVRSQ